MWGDSNIAGLAVLGDIGLGDRDRAGLAVSAGGTGSDVDSTRFAANFAARAFGAWGTNKS